MIRSRLSVILFLVLGWMFGSDHRATASVYNFGETGVFGLAETWTFNGVGITLDTATERYSARFTALENLTVDRSWQRLLGFDAGTTIRVSIVKDNGSGAPSSNPIDVVASSADTASPEGILAIPFTSSASLVAGNVYHLVTEPVVLTGNGFQIFSSTNAAASNIRPYDKNADLSMNAMTSTNSGSTWVTSIRDPFFTLGDSSGAVGGPGQPYENTLPNNLFTQGGAGSKLGQSLRITAGEIPDDGYVRFKQFRLQVAAAGTGVSADMIMRFREADGTVLGSVTVPVSQMGAFIQTFTLDNVVYLQEGVDYLFTTELSGVSTTSHFYRILSYHSTAGLGPATWGGTTWATVLTSANNWASHSAPLPDWDLALSFDAEVVSFPEPSVGAILLACAALLRRRQRRSVECVGLKLERA